jgi:hypothetical protein
VRQERQTRTQERAKERKMPTIDPDAATTILQNIKNKHCDQQAKKRATPYRTHRLSLLKRHIWKPLIFKTRQAMYVKRNIVARSRNHCYRVKAISITYCECVFLSLVIQHAKRMRHITICRLPRYKILFHIIS